MVALCYNRTFKPNTNSFSVWNIEPLQAGKPTQRPINCHSGLVKQQLKSQHTMPRLKAFQASIQKRILLFWGYCIRLAHTLFKSNSSAAWFDSKEMFTPVCCNLDNNYYDINIIKQLNTKPAHCHWTFLSLHSFSAGVFFVYIFG